jgi:hypothetical protein
VTGETKIKQAVAQQGGQMESAGAWRPVAAAWVLRLSLALALMTPYLLQAQGTKAKTTRADRPGDASYTPTKLEWAALELQASYGSTIWTTETPVMINYIAAGDGETIDCVLQYTPEVPAAVLKINRDAAQVVFNKYAASRCWSWLRIQFEERVLSRSR